MEPGTVSHVPLRHPASFGKSLASSPTPARLLLMRVGNRNVRKKSKTDDDNKEHFGGGKQQEGVKQEKGNVLLSRSPPLFIGLFSLFSVLMEDKMGQ